MYFANGRWYDAALRFWRGGRAGRRRSPAKGVWGLSPHRGFKSLSLRHSAPVAQLDRVPGYEPGGRRFESVRARQISADELTNTP